MSKFTKIAFAYRYYSIVGTLSKRGVHSFHLRWDQRGGSLSCASTPVPLPSHALDTIRVWAADGTYHLVRLSLEKNAVLKFGYS